MLVVWSHEPSYHLTHNAHSGQNQLDNFGEIFQAKAYLGKYLKEKYLSEQYQQLSIIYFVK